jgi:phage terminase small subunit
MPGNWNSGRRKEPPALKLLRGNPGRRRITQAEREAAAQLPDALDPAAPPAELEGNDRARNEWRRIAANLTTAEYTSTIALCLEWAAYLDAQAQLRTARVRKGTTGVPRISPYVVIADRALNQCLRLWNELGLTPGSRAKKLPTARTPPASKWGNL